MAMVRVNCHCATRGVLSAAAPDKNERAPAAVNGRPSSTAQAEFTVRAISCRVRAHNKQECRRQKSRAPHLADLAGNHLGCILGQPEAAAANKRARPPARSRALNPTRRAFDVTVRRRTQSGHKAARELAQSMRNVLAATHFARRVGRLCLCLYCSCLCSRSQVTLATTSATCAYTYEQPKGRGRLLSQCHLYCGKRARATSARRTLAPGERELQLQLRPELKLKLEGNAERWSDGAETIGRLFMHVLSLSLSLSRKPAGRLARMSASQ